MNFFGRKAELCLNTASIVLRWIVMIYAKIILVMQINLALTAKVLSEINKRFSRKNLVTFSSYIFEE